MQSKLCASVNDMVGFRIAAAQIATVPGDIDANVGIHAAALALAAQQQVDMLVFPELSLTGYEPELAAELAINPDDGRLEPLVALARHHGVEVVVGAPLRNGPAKPALGALLIGADGVIGGYHKISLGAGEHAFFSPGDSPTLVRVAGHTVAIAICADSSQIEHPRKSAELGADVYAAGVFLNAEWYATDVSRLAHHAVRFRMLTLMANHAESPGTFTSVGRSAAWAPDGSLLAEIADAKSALLIAASSHHEWRGEIVSI